MKATYFKSRPRSLSSYEQDLIKAWGMSRRTAPLLSKLRDLTGDEWQLSDKDTAAAASALHEMGFEKFVAFTAAKADDTRRFLDEVFADSEPDYEREILLEESVGTLRNNQEWVNGRVISH
jgi:hypothetical protein